MPRQEPVEAKKGQTLPSAPASAKKPADRFREGPVHVSIWENEGSNGAFRTASFEIRFRKGEDWQSGTSYGLSELAHLEIAAKQARMGPLHRPAVFGEFDACTHAGQLGQLRAQAQHGLQGKLPRVQACV